MAKTESEFLKEIRDNVQSYVQSFKENNERFMNFLNFAFVSSINTQEQATNNELNRPTIEFNVCEAYISRYRGEFSKNEPSISVHAQEGHQVDYGTIKLVEDHLRYILHEANKNGFSYDIYTDTMAGGFSAAKVYTDYVSEMSFNQDIYIEKCYNPTLTGFDVLAKRHDKRDGRFCFELYPLTEEEFKLQFPNVDIKKINFSKSFDTVHWSYMKGMTKYILVCDYYEKKQERRKIVMLSDNRVMTQRDYNQFLRWWDEQGFIAAPPEPVGKPRMTTLTQIVRYRCIENQILEERLTDYDYLPIVFFDGNSIITKTNSSNSVKQYTRPAIYHAVGAQRLKNLAGQTLANELESISQAQMLVPKDGVALEYKEAYQEPQKANVLVYNPYKDDNPEQPLPPPQILQRRQIPPEISQTFGGMDSTIQQILGSFDASLAKLTESQTSGIAIQETMGLSNATIMPYIVSYLKGLQSIADIIVSLIPKIYKTPRTIPVMTEEGKKDYVYINEEGQPRLDYDNTALRVRIDAGPSFAVQQSKAFDQMVALTKVSPLFGQFMAEEGLPVWLDNMEFRGIEYLKEAAEQYMQKIKQMQQQQAQMPNPEMIKVQNEQQKLALEQQKAQMKNEIEALKLEMEEQKLRIEKMSLLTRVHETAARTKVEAERNEVERLKTEAEIHIKHNESQHELLKTLKSERKEK